MQHRGRQGGFSLLEALVTLAILSVVLMGLAFLQAQGMRLNTSAYARTQASFLVSSIVDRMRVNNSDALAAYDTSSFDPTPGSCSVSAAPAADNDRDCWYGRLEDALPDGDGTIAVSGNKVTVTVSWTDRPVDLGQDATASSLTQTDLVKSLSMSVVL